MILRTFAVALLLSTILARPSPAATVHGTVRPPADASRRRPDLNPYPGRAQSMRASQPPRAPVMDVVVYVDGPAPGRGDPGPGAAKSRAGARLAQENQSFAPRVIPIVAGASVEFPNRDPIYHNVFSVSPTKRFDLGKYGRGKSKSVAFPKPGLVNVYCDIHSNMEGFIVVLPHAWFAQPDARGEFALPELPAGTYRIKAWHPDWGERVTTVTLGKAGDRGVDLAY